MVQKRISKKFSKKRRSIKRRSSKKQVGGSKKTIIKRSKLRKSLDFIKKHKKSIGLIGLGAGLGAIGLKHRKRTVEKKANESIYQELKDRLNRIRRGIPRSISSIDFPKIP